MHTNAVAVAALTLIAAPSLGLHAGQPDARNDRWQTAVEKHTIPIIEAGLVPGLVVAIHADDRTAFFPVGTLTPDGNEPPTPDTLYEIGSITKVFTALLLADAERRGEAQLDAPLADHTPDDITVPTFAGTDTPITLRHLASHTSGLPRLPANFAPADINDPYADFTEANAWDALAATALATEPGTTYAYSNYATGLLGTVLAHAADTDYENLLKTRVFAPAGMTTATISLTPDARRKLAPPHAAGNVPNHNWTFDALAGAGSVRASARDMITFAEDALEPKTQALSFAMKMTTKPLGTVAPGGHGYATGWMIAGDGNTLFHGGQTGGYHSAMFISPALDAAVVVLANGADPNVSAAAEKIVQTLAGLNPPPLTFETTDLTDAQLDRLVGVYHNPIGITYHVTRQGDAIFARIEGQPAFRVWPESPTEFTYREVEARLVFAGEPNAPATAVTLFQNGQEFRCERR